MIGILPMVLKIIGIVILTIIALALLIILMVLFIPVRYKGKVYFKEVPDIALSITWFFKFLSLNITYKEGLDIIGKVGWLFKVYSNHDEDTDINEGLEDYESKVEETVDTVNENKKDILNALTKINQVSNNKNIKVAYIKILGKVLEFNKAIETFYYSHKPGYNEVYQERIESLDNSLDEFRRIKASLKPDFDKEQYSEEVEYEFNSLLSRVEGRTSVIFEDDKDYSFNNYLVTLINEKQLEEFIWLNTLYNIYKEGSSINNIVRDYCELSDVEFSDLYKIYLFVTDYNINQLLLKNESKIINNEYLENFENFFNYMYQLIDDLRTFVAKKDKENILNFATKIESYTNVSTPSKEEFISSVRKVFNFLRTLYENDNAKLLLDNIYPILVKSFFAPLKNDDKIKYDFNPEFIYALEYTQIIIEVMDENNGK